MVKEKGGEEERRKCSGEGDGEGKVRRRRGGGEVLWYQVFMC